MNPSSIDDNPDHFDTQIISNSPNPCRTTTSISYSILEPGHVSLEVYNLLGQLIESPLDEVKHAGYHNFEWNTSNLETGIYFVKLLTAESNSVKRIVHIK